MLLLFKKMKILLFSNNSKKATVTVDVILFLFKAFSQLLPNE